MKLAKKNGYEETTIKGRKALEMYATKNQEEKIVAYIKERFTDENTVDVIVEPNGDWYTNDYKEDCRCYQVKKIYRRPYDGKIFEGATEDVEVELENAEKEEHLVQLISLG